MFCFHLPAAAALALHFAATGCGKSVHEINGKGKQ
jgi:hypothetical protein